MTASAHAACATAAACVGDGVGGGGSKPPDDGNPTFRIVDLGTLGGDSSRAYGINELNDIVGGSTDESGTEVAVIWTLDAEFRSRICSAVALENFATTHWYGSPPKSVSG